MNNLMKGFFTVVVATIITSGMILMTGKTIADSTSAQQKEGSVSETTDTVRKVLSNGVNVPNANDDDTVATGYQAPLPPPGPYLHSKGNDDFNELKTLKPPAAPEAPTNPTKNENIVLAKPEINVDVPLLKKLPKVSLDTSLQVDKNISKKSITKPELTINEPKAPSISSVAPMIKTDSIKSSFEAPKLPQLSLTVPSERSNAPEQKIHVTEPPIAPQNTSKQPVLMNHGKPIWMQQDSERNQGITNPNSQPIQQQALKSNMGNYNFTGANGMQQYRYVPMPVYPSYYYPQMPMNNSVPMPNYWMPLMNPENPSIEQNPAGSPFSQPVKKSSH